MPWNISKITRRMMYNNLFFNYIFIDGIVRKLQPLYINNEEVFEVHTLFFGNKNMEETEESLQLL